MQSSLLHKTDVPKLELTLERISDTLLNQLFNVSYQVYKESVYKLRRCMYRADQEVTCQF